MVKASQKKNIKKNSKKSYKKIILHLLKEKYEEAPRGGISRVSLTSRISQDYEIKDESIMKKYVSKRIIELQSEGLIKHLKDHPHTFRITSKGRKNLISNITRKLSRVSASNPVKIKSKKTSTYRSKDKKSSQKTKKVSRLNSTNKASKNQNSTATPSQRVKLYAKIPRKYKNNINNILSNNINSNTNPITITNPTTNPITNSTTNPIFNFNPQSTPSFSFPNFQLSSFTNSTNTYLKSNNIDLPISTLSVICQPYSMSSQTYQFSPTNTTPKILWIFKSSIDKGSALFVNENFVFFGSQLYVYVINRLSGKLIKTIKFNSEVLCIVGDDQFLYCGLSNGCIYDFTSDPPRLVYHIMGGRKISYLDICNGYIAADLSGICILLNMEGEVIWRIEGVGYNKFVKTDGEYVYHCKQENVTAYKFYTGEAIWTTKAGKNVTFGSMDKDSIYTASNEVIVLDKLTGKITKLYDQAIPWSISVTQNGDPYSLNEVYASDIKDCIHCYNKETGENKWIVKTDGSIGNSLQYFNGILYCVTDKGSLIAYDPKTLVPKEDLNSIHVVENNTNIHQHIVEPKDTVSKTQNRSKGILVHIVHDGTRLRARSHPSEISYNSNLNIQFPHNLRKEGKKYIVSQLILSNDHKFYRSYGEISEWTEE